MIVTSEEHFIDNIERYMEVVKSIPAESVHVSCSNHNELVLLSEDDTDTMQPKTGVWIDVNNGSGSCSICGKKSNVTPYCGHCGALMHDRAVTE